VTSPLARLALLLAGTAVLGAAPRPAKTPAASRAPADSIYGLAVDSTRYRDYPFVYLLDDGVVRIEGNGRYTKTYRQVVQILKPAGVDQWAEKRFTFAPDRERVKLNWMRVVSLTGEVLSDKPSVVQESDVPAGMESPVYTQTKVLRYSLGNVAPGTLVDASWTIEQTKPALPGDFLDDWNVTPPTPGLRSRYVLDVPASVTPRIIERHLDFKRAEQEQGGRHVYTWATQNLKPVKGEMFAPDSSVPVMSIGVGAPLTWGEIGHWYNDLSKDRYVLTPAIIAIVDSLVRAAKTRHDTLTTLHRWIARDLRYVSISLGIGGYQPRFPEATVGTRYGDCKDKATLFIAAARHLGFSAYPVLLDADGGPQPELPAIEDFNHVVAAVEERADDLTFIDLTTFDFPTGVVATSYQGGFGLLVFPDGKTRELTFPKDSVGMTDWRFEGELSKDGRVSGRLVQTETGLAAYGLRISFTEMHEMHDSAFRADMKRGAPKPFANAVVDTVIFPDGNDWVNPLSLEVREHDGRGGQLSGTMMVLSIPSVFRGAGTGFRDIADRLQQDSVRTLPIDAEEVTTRVPSRRELRLTLPEGWAAQLPQSVSAVSDFGTYRAEYSQTGRELRIMHTTQGAKGVYPAARIKDLIEWLRLASKDDAEFVTITVPR
jgi:transglutaminase-like putative cysteine protease